MFLFSGTIIWVAKAETSGTQRCVCIFLRSDSASGESISALLSDILHVAKWKCLGTGGEFVSFLFTVLVKPN